MALPEVKEVYSTHGSSVLTTSNRSEMSNLAPCTHEEADTRLMIHALDASLRGHQRIKIRTNDTDVIVLALSVVSTLPVDEFWITYGSGKSVQHMPVHVVASSLGPSKASAVANVPRLDRVRHSFILPQPWKEVCMGCLERLSRVDPSSMRFEGFTRDHHRRITCCLGKVCGTSL